MKIERLLIALHFLAILAPCHSQVHVNLNGSADEVSAMLQVSSSDRGFLMPGMTYRERDWIYDPDPAEGLVIYNEQKKMYQYWNGSKWRTFARELSNKVHCGNDMIDARDGQVYGTVQIGDQCWMAENLNIGFMQDTSTNQSQNDTIERYCYNQNIDHCAEYGGLYQWDEAMGYDYATPAQGICPDGWHIPTGSEWGVLNAYLADSTGKKMKEAGFLHWSSGGNISNNLSGFTALGAGYFSWHVTFVYLLSQTKFWQSIAKDSDEAYSVGLTGSSNTLSFGYEFKYEAVSVRCVKD